MRPEDFVVEERLGFAPGGSGDHAWLRIRKRDCNTHWVAGRLARFAGVAPGAVGYAGLKDRRAVTEQWFSVNLSGRPEPNWQALDEPGVEVLEITRGRRKLRRGSLSGNRFVLRLTDVQGDRAAVEHRCLRIATAGVPSYFGPQRFGRGGSNVSGARSLFAGRRVRDRTLRGLYLSAARSLLFNRVLAARVRRGDWDRWVPGEAVMLEGTHSLFVPETADARLGARLRGLDLHPTGPLWGRGPAPSAGEALAVETGALEAEPALRAGLEAAGLRQERRALRVRVAGLEARWPAAGVLELGFSLPAGAYATSVLREVVTLAG